MEPIADRHDVTALLGGVFDLNAKPTEVAMDLRVIRRLLEDDDGEAEEEEEDG